VKTTARLASLAAFTGLALTGCGAASEIAPETAAGSAPAATIEAVSAPSVDLDPRACYIDSTGPAVHPEAVELVCGNGSTVALDVTRTGDNSSYVKVSAEQGEVDGWAVENPQGGVYGDGSTVVQVSLKKGEEDCLYYRPLGMAPERTDTNCSGFDRKL
jgi:hypothetical protein